MTENYNPEDAEVALKNAGFKVTKLKNQPKNKKRKGEAEMPPIQKSRGAALVEKYTQIKQDLAAKGISLEDTRSTVQGLKAIAPDLIKLCPEAQAVLRELNQELGGKKGEERWRINPELRAQGETAEDILYLGQVNPFVREVLAQQRREERIKRTTEIRKKGTINLHKAVNGEEGEVTVRVSYQDKYTQKPRTGWLGILVNPPGHQGQGHIVESTVPFLSGTNREGREIWFPIGTPPQFPEIRSPELREAFVDLYKFEEEMAARDAKIREILDKQTISVTQAMAKEVGHFAAHHPNWNTPQGGGPVVYGGDSTEEYLILRDFYAPNGQINLSDLIGQEQRREALDPRFKQLIQYRLGYEARRAEKEQASQVEPAEEES